MTNGAEFQVRYSYLVNDRYLNIPHVRRRI